MRPPPAPRAQTVDGNIADARAAWQVLGNRGLRPKWPAARLAYNNSLAAAFDDLRRADGDWAKAADTIGTRLAERASGQLDPALRGTLFPASRVDVSKVGTRQQVEGLGLPLVGWVDQSTGIYQSLHSPLPSGGAANITALLRFDRGPLPTWEFRQPYRAESVSLGRVEHPLETDWSAAHALYWRMSALDQHKIINVLRPERIGDVEGLFFAQQPDPDRIPLIFVHGLRSAPDTFAQMVNKLLGEPWFRRNYQVWFYSYSTGVPWMLSATRFRSHFAAATGLARRLGVRHLDRTVIVGHSMGGLITQASLRDPGNTVYDYVFKKPIDQLELRPDERQLVADGFLWKPLPLVSRAVFLAAPHRGSPIADRQLSNALSKLIVLPKMLTVDLADAVVRNTAAIADPWILGPEERLRRRGGAGSTWLPNGIKSLSPERPMFKIVPELPFRPGVRLHSVIADRGKGDSSDGVVPYWSSHLTGVDSELIVPSGHSVTRNPETIREVKRILRLHLADR